MSKGHQHQMVMTIIRPDGSSTSEFVSGKAHAEAIVAEFEEDWALLGLHYTLQSKLDAYGVTDSHSYDSRIGSCR